MTGRHLVLASIAALALSACKTRAPYPPGQGPTSAELVKAAAPQIDAVQVANARVVVERLARGNLAFIAQRPGRFRGGVEFKGAEVVTLAFDEEGYALRNKLDQFPEGFYSGPPPADCAVEALLGIRFPTEALVSLVLGGGPLLAAPYEVGKSKWSRKGGYEALELRNAQVIEELRFDLIGGAWRIVGGALWENAGGRRGRELWSFEHRDLEPADGVVLPERTRITSPSKRGETLVVITYRERNLKPAFAKATTPSGDDGGQDDGGGEDDGGDDWGGGEDWGDENEGWENAEGDAPAEGDTGAPEPAPTEGDSEPPKDTAPPKPVRSPVPSVFKIDGTGLTDRGDLCR
jgi:hypothetical protein